MCKAYTDVGGIKYLYHVCPPVRKIIHSLKLVDYLHVQADKPWYNYYLASMNTIGEKMKDEFGHSLYVALTSDSNVISLF